MSALGDIAAGLGPAASGISQGLLGGAERQNALQQQAFSQGQARTKLDLDKQELQLRGKALDSQETQQARQILSNMQSEVWKHRTDPALESYWQGAGKDVAARMDDWLNRSYHALASNKATDLFSVMQEHPEAAMHHATAAGIPLPAGAQAQPATPASGGAGTPTNGSAPPVAAPPAAGGAGGGQPPVSPEVKALVQSLFGPVMGGPQPAQLPPGVAGPQPPGGAFRDATGTVMPPAASTPAPTVGAGPAAMAQAGGATGAAPVAAAPAGSPATAGQTFATYGDIANAAGVPNAAAPTLDAATSAVAKQFLPQPGELPSQEAARVNAAVESLAKLGDMDRAKVTAWLGYHKDVMDRASAEGIAKANNAAAMARTQVEQGGSMARTKLETGSAQTIAGQRTQAERDIAGMTDQRERDLASARNTTERDVAQMRITAEDGWKTIAQQTRDGQQQIQQVNAYNSAQRAANMQTRVQANGMNQEINRAFQLARAAEDKYTSTGTTSQSGGARVNLGLPNGLGVGGGLNLNASQSLMDQQGVHLHNTPEAQRYFALEQKRDNMLLNAIKPTVGTYDDLLKVTKPLNQLPGQPNEGGIIKASLTPKGYNGKTFTDLFNSALANNDPMAAYRLAKIAKSMGKLPTGLNLRAILGADLSETDGSAPVTAGGPPVLPPATGPLSALGISGSFPTPGVESVSR